MYAWVAPSGVRAFRHRFRRRNEARIACEALHALVFSALWLQLSILPCVSDRLPALTENEREILRVTRSCLLDRSDVKFAHVHEVAGNGRGRGHDWADQVRAAVFALAAFEIAVRSARAAFMWRQNIRVHANAHAAAGIAPLKACGGENLVEPFFFRLRLYSARAGHNERLLDVFRHVLAGHEMGSGAQIIEP